MSAEAPGATFGCLADVTDCTKLLSCRFARPPRNLRTHGGRCETSPGLDATDYECAHRKPAFRDAVFGHFLSSSTRGVRASSQTVRAGVVGRERRAARETARRSGRTGAGTRVLCLGFQKGPSELAIFLFSVLIPFLGFLQYYTIRVFAKEEQHLRAAQAGNRRWRLSRKM